MGQMINLLGEEIFVRLVDDETNDKLQPSWSKADYQLETTNVKLDPSHTTYQVNYEVLACVNPMKMTK